MKKILALIFAFILSILLFLDNIINIAGINYSPRTGDTVMIIAVSAGAAALIAIFIISRRRKK